MKLIFLDIDGVLNDHEFDPVSDSCTIKRECVQQLNRILVETGAQIIVSSAWRYMVLNGAMTLRGFGYLLQTHGVITGRVWATTKLDIGGESRGRQIRDWLSENTNGDIPFVVLDDERLCGFDEVRDNLVLTDGSVGLTEADADKAIQILDRSQDQ
ncbi:MAG: HAD domain-containing protein [Geminicoccaceae bacterium]